MNPGQSLRANTQWVFTGSLAFRVFGFIFGVVLARLLVPADFGTIVTIQIFTGILGYVAGGGMGEALVQAKEAKPQDFRVVFTIQLAICILIYLFLFLLAPWVAVWFDNPLIVDLMRVNAISFLFRPFLNIPSSLLRRQMKFKWVAINRVVGSIIGGIVSIAFALFDYGPWSLVLGGLAGSIANLALFYWHTRWVPGFAYERESARRLGGFGIRMSVNSIIDYLRKQIPNIIVARVQGPAMVGLFNKSDSLASLPVEIFSGSVYQTTFRALSSIQDNAAESRRLYEKALALVLVYTLPIYVGFIWTAQTFIVVVYGDKWIDSAAALQILSSAGLFRCVSNLSGAVVAAQNRLGHEMRIQTETTVLLAAGCLLGVQYGLEGWPGHWCSPTATWRCAWPGWLSGAWIPTGAICLGRSSRRCT